jgi:hypothetical protein
MMDLVEAEQKLEIKDEDINAIRRAKDPNWVLRGLIAIAVAFLSFLIGFVVGRVSDTGSSNYPYGTLLLASAAVGSRKRIPVLFIALLAVLSFISLNFGLAEGSPNFGVVTYYGSYSPET